METHPNSTNPPPSSLLAQSPTSSENLADIAARVLGELNLHDRNPFDSDNEYSLPNHDDDDDDDDDREEDVGNESDDDESEFEFAILCGDDTPSSPISADEIFSNGQIKPTWPLFDTNLIFQNNNQSHIHIQGHQQHNNNKQRLPLRKLMKEDKVEYNGSCASDELEGVPQESYCVWGPKKKEKSETMRKKSKSTGSNSNTDSISKRWKIKDLVHRSNSDGKDTFVFLTPSHHRHNTSAAGQHKRRPFNNKNKSYLPYKQEIVGGLFANVNVISRNVRPF